MEIFAMISIVCIFIAVNISMGFDQTNMLMVLKISLLRWTVFYLSVQPVVELKPVELIDGRNYLVGKEYEEMTIECALLKGTLPVTAHIYINDESRPSKTLSNTNQQYTFLLEPRHHLSYVKCCVRNDAGSADIVYQLYVLSSKYSDNYKYSPPPLKYLGVY